MLENIKWKSIENNWISQYLKDPECGKTDNMYIIVSMYHVIRVHGISVTAFQCKGETFFYNAVFFSK